MDTQILINKPKGMTSHDVVNRIRRITGVRKVGHGGTLDPNATGLLIVGIGREGTKRLGNVSKGMDKEYEAEITLGMSSSTDDSEGELVKSNETMPYKEEVVNVINSFLGKSMQVPPAFSAIKLGGKKAYNEARRGRPLELPAREIAIHSIKLLNYNYPKIILSCEVSSGTYIRALARDIGERLKTGAYLSNLKRTRIGAYKLANALELEQFEKQWKS
jgi:tRNA pseudouridine55 synthase